MKRGLKVDNSKKYGKLSVKFLASALSVVTLFPAVTPCANAINSKEVKSVNSVIMKMKNVEEYAKELTKKGYKKISTLVENYPKTVTAIATTLVLSAIVSVVFVYYKSHRDVREHDRIWKIERCLDDAKFSNSKQKENIAELQQRIASQQEDIARLRQSIADQQGNIAVLQLRNASQQRQIAEQQQIIDRLEPVYRVMRSRTNGR